MKYLLIIFFLYLNYFRSTGQTENRLPDFNFGFENTTVGKELPDKWFKWGGPQKFDFYIDSVVKHNGKYSVRIEPAGKFEEHSFGCCAYRIPAFYSGKEIEVRAFLKMENSESPIGLLLRIDGDKKAIQFDNMQQKGIKGTRDWAEYSVKLPLPKEAKIIFIGFLLSSSGKLWADDFNVLIDGEDISKLIPKKKVETIIEKDTSLSKSTGISINDLTNEKIIDLVVLGKVWGFLKYYHPSVAGGKYNWDNELFRILPRIIECKKSNERNEILSSWIDSLGSIKIEKKKKISGKEIKLMPDLVWLEDQKILGDILVKQLTGIRNSEREESGFYIDMTEGVGNPVFKNEKSYTTFDQPDVGYYLLSLYRYWNMIQYFNPNKKLMDEDWNNVLKDFIPEFIRIDNEGEYQLQLLKLIAKVQDTHANLRSNSETLKKIKGTNIAPFEIAFVENKAVVKNYYLPKGKNTDSAIVNIDTTTGIKIGDVILKINDKDVEDIIKERLPITSASNYPTQLRNIARELFRTNDTSLNILFEHDGLKKSITINCYSPGKLDVLDKYLYKDTCFKLLEPGIALIYPGTIKNEYLPKTMPGIMKSKGIIIDMRCYPSEFIVFTLTNYLMPHKTEFVKFSIGNVRTPGLFTYTPVLETGKSNKEYYKGKVVILINEITQSQAEYTTMALRVAPNAKVIGSTTAGADGNISEIILPGGVKSVISGIGVYYPDGTETQRVGIVPDVEVKPTILGIKERRDEVLEKAIELIKGE